MRAHYLQHVSFEALGSIAPWLESAGYQITATKFFESTTLPDPEDVDLLIIMGGPMSVNEEDRFPWLRTEKRFIRQTIESGRAVLGICLGAQLIASALGESVYPNRRKVVQCEDLKAQEQGVVLSSHALSTQRSRPCAFLSDPPPNQTASTSPSISLRTSQAGPRLPGCSLR